MAPSTNHPFGFKTAIILLLIFSPSKSVGSGSDGSDKEVKMVLGSRPPRCVNRCFSCTPCTAALVTPPHHRIGAGTSYQGDESYYLLGWKCRCGNKFFQP